MCIRDRNRIADKLKFKTNRYEVAARSPLHFEEQIAKQNLYELARSGFLCNTSDMRIDYPKMNIRLNWFEYCLVYNVANITNGNSIPINMELGILIHTLY